MLTHIHHMTPQTPFHISKIMASNNIEKLIPWTCLIQSVLQIKNHAWFEYLESNKAISTLQGTMSIPIHAFVTYVQINHFCDYRCNYPLWHLLKTTCSCINDYKVVSSCICNLNLQIMSILMKMKMKNNLYHPFSAASQNRWKYSCFYDLKGGS